MMFILLTWCEFQKYALTSLQQLLADHPPAPEGLDPDIGTGLIKHLSSFVFSLLFSFLLWWHEKITSYQLRQDHICRKIIFFFWGGGGRGRGLTNAVQSEGENNLTLNSETTRNLYNGLFGRGYFSLRGCEKKHRSHRG